MIFALLFLGLFSFADQVKDYGIGLSTAELRDSGYRSKQADGILSMEKKDGNTLMKLRSAKGAYVSVMMSNELTRDFSYVELEEKGRALARTRCLFDAKTSKYTCTTQTNNYCQALMQQMAQGAFKSDLAKLNECESILQKVSYNAPEISKAQVKGIERLKADFEIPAEQMNVQVPKRITSIGMLMNDFHECKSMEKLWFASEWAPTTSQNEKPVKGNN